MSSDAILGSSPSVSSAPAAAQYDATTKGGTTPMGGPWITGLATELRVIPDFNPVSRLNARLPGWILFSTVRRIQRLPEKHSGTAGGYASGDSGSGDGVHGTFSAIYPSARDRFGIADLFGWQNIKAERAGFRLEPFRRRMMTSPYHKVSPANATDAVYNSSNSSIARDITGRTGPHVGGEFGTCAGLELSALEYRRQRAVSDAGQLSGVLTKGPCITTCASPSTSGMTGPAAVRLTRLKGKYDIDIQHENR